MVTAGEGWEMAFYVSPAIFFAVDAILWLGSGIAAWGLAIGPNWYQRVQCLAASLLNLACFAMLP